LDRPITSNDRWRLRLHLLVCDMCSRFERQIDLMRVAIRKLGN